MPGTTPLVTISTHVRAMRGGAHAHLVQGMDGHHYVVKFRQNPQGRRTLINEVVSSILLRRLGVYSPEIALIGVDPDSLRTLPGCNLGRENDQTGILPGIHFGSQYPGSPDVTSVFDLFPTQMAPQLYNRADFLGALVFDKWVSNADSRQAIFFRAIPERSGQERWVAAMIDNGYAFQGCRWTFGDSAAQGLHARWSVYGPPITLDDFGVWIYVLRQMKWDVEDEIFDTLPREWFEGDEADLRMLLRRLDLRRPLVRELVSQSVQFMQSRSKRQRIAPFVTGPGEMLPVPQDTKPKSILLKIREHTPALICMQRPSLILA